MRSMLFLSIILSTSAALAGDVSEQANLCFNPPISAEKDYFASFSVELDERGRLRDATVQDGWRPSRELVLAGVRALQRCGPYTGFENQTVTATFKRRPSKQIDPFKGQ